MSLPRIFYYENATDNVEIYKIRYLQLASFGGYSGTVNRTYYLDKVYYFFTKTNTDEWTLADDIGINNFKYVCP